MKPADFAFVAAMLREKSGLVLTQDKVYLIENRLMPIARRRTMAGLDELVTALRQGRDAALVREVVEAMTTNESFFFRDIKPFQQFSDHFLPKLMAARERTRTLRIWSAACSTGQEPYSLAMILKEKRELLAGWRIEIVATDISRPVLERAKSGFYTQFEVQRGLPVHLMVKYFEQAEGKWRIHPSLRTMVEFREFNLLEDLRPIGRCDIIFCRNVLIYFDQPIKARVLDGMSRLLPADGVLWLGGAETVLGVTDRFAPVPGMPGAYGLTAAAQPAAGALPPAPEPLTPLRQAAG